MLFDDVYKMMLSPNKTSLDMSLADVHAKGVFSLVVGGNENGKLTRIFIATKKIRPFDIQFHSHCYDLKIGVIKGSFEHHIATQKSSGINSLNLVHMKKYKYTSPLRGGIGLQEDDEVMYHLSSYHIPVGGEIYLESDDIHSVSVSKGSMWIVQEQGFNRDSSIVLGTKFVTDGLYNKPEQFQVNDMFQKVLIELEKIVC